MFDQEKTGECRVLQPESGGKCHGADENEQNGKCEITMVIHKRDCGFAPSVPLYTEDDRSRQQGIHAWNYSGSDETDRKFVMR